MLRNRRELFIKWTAEGMVKGRFGRVFHDVGHASVAGNMIVFHEEREGFTKQGGTAVRIITVLV